MSYEEWKWNCALVGEVAEINKRSVKKTDELDEIFYVDVSSVNDRQITNVQQINFKDAPSRARRLVKHNDIIISTVRPNLKHFTIIENPPANMLVSTGFAVLTAKKIDPHFLYYYLTTDNYTNYLTSIAEGQTSAYPAFNPDIIAKSKIHFPSLHEQRDIVSILKNIDQKIQHNNQINQKLEEIAQAIFKSWFIDFEPFQDGEFIDSELGPIPKGWEIASLKDISVEVVCGKTPSTKKKENFGDEMMFITIPDMHGKVFVTHTERGLSKIGIKSQEKKTIPPNSVCVSCIATPGVVALTSLPSQTNQQINSIVCKKDISYYYIFLAMRNISWLIKSLGSSGSTTLNLNKTEFSKIKILVPSLDVLNRFHEAVRPLFNQILELQKQSQTLTTLRDTLLPKLMSGEIRVPLIDEEGGITHESISGA